MSEYRSDEETVELIQRWWRENGLLSIGTVVVVLGGVIGYNQWQASQQTAIGEIASSYLEWSEARTPDSVSPDADVIAERLRAEHPESAYTALLRFDDARRAVEGDDVPAARVELDAILAMDLPAFFHDLARIRLAKLDLAEEAPADALARLDAVQGAEAIAAVLELRGDAHRALGDLAAARSAYDAAITAAEASQFSGLPLLRLKRDDIAPATASTSVVGSDDFEAPVEDDANGEDAEDDAAPTAAADTEAGA